MKIRENFPVQALDRLRRIRMSRLAFVCNASGSTTTPTIEIKSNQ